MTDEGIHHALQDIVPVIVIVTMTIATVSIVKGLIGAFRNRSMLRAQTDFHNKILDKFGTAEEFTAYLQSEAGGKFFENLSKEPASPMTKILSSIQKGAILTLLGIGFLLFGLALDLSVDVKIAALLIATISTATGIGFIISAVISHRLAKTWGIITAGDATVSSPPIANLPPTVAP